MGTLLMAVAFLTGCAGAVPWNNQGNAGINKAVIEFNEDGHPEYAEIIGGKEQEDISLDVETPSGLKVSYSAKGVKAFSAHEIRGAVEQAVASDAAEVSPAIVDTITNGILGIVNTPAALIPAKE